MRGCCGPKPPHTAPCPCPHPRRYQGLDVSDTIFLGKRFKEAGINNFMFHSFEPGKVPMERWVGISRLAAACG